MNRPLDDLRRFGDMVTFDRDASSAPAACSTLNTRLTYRYRDADNYKTSNTVVFAGEPTPELLALVRGALNDGDSFIPSQVGLEDLQGHLQQYDSPASQEEYAANPASDPDHPWHELEPTLGAHLELTEDPPDVHRPGDPAGAAVTFREFAEAMAEQTWDDTIAVR